MRPSPLLAAAFAGLLLCGCVSQGPYPSLAPRPEESDFSTAEPVRPEPQVADDVQLRSRIGTLAAQALEGLRAFDTAFPAAERAVGAAGAAGSESWSEAQLALSRLEATRGRTTSARAELDRIAIERANVPTSAADRAILERALTEVERIGMNQQVRLSQLTERMPNR